MSGWRVSCTIIAGLGVALVIAACGGSPQYQGQRTGSFPVEVTRASFPASQSLTQHVHMVLTVRNTGNKPIPNLAVTVCNVTCTYPAPPGEGTTARPFSTNIKMQGVSDPSRPDWVIDRPPGTCTGPQGYSCASGGPGGDVTNSPNTWALGAPLKPGATATFDWAVTAVNLGTHTVAWQLAAGLGPDTKAVLADGSIPHGSFTVSVSGAPQQAYVNNNGQIVRTPGPPPLANSESQGSLQPSP